MVKYLKHALVLLLFVSAVLTVSFAANSGDTMQLTGSYGDNFPYIDEMVLTSSRYTQTDDVDPGILDDYLNNYKINYSLEELELMGFLQVLENDNFILYFEEVSFSIMLYDKQGDFYWSSRGEGLVPQDANISTRNRMNSGIIVDYATIARPDIVRTDSLLSITEATYQTNNEELPERIRPYVITPSSVSSAYVAVSTETVGDTLVAEIQMKSFRQTGFNIPINFRFIVEVTLTDLGIEVYIPTEHIVDDVNNHRILSISVFPFFGSTKQNRVPGYFVVPDQMGALIRLNTQYSSQIPDMPFYSFDYGYNARQSGTSLSMPMFGVVHQVGEHAFYAEIKEGAETSALQLFLWNQNSQFQRINAKFNLRQLYRTVIDRAGNGVQAILSNHTASDYRIAYYMLNDDDASYVGIAKDYRDKLIDRAILSPRELTNNDGIPMQSTFILSDQEPSFIGTSKVTMTTIDQAIDIYNELKVLGVLNQQVNLQGWSNDGNLINTPFNFNYVEDAWRLRMLADIVTNDGNTIYLENNYVLSTENSSRINYNTDIAYGLNKLRITFGTIGANRNAIEYRYVYPHRSFELVSADLGHINDLRMSGIHHRSLGVDLVTYMQHNNVYEASETMYYYQTIAGLTEKTSIAAPSLYLWEHINAYTNLNIANDQYNYYTDLVPLIPIILKGSVSYFSNYLNFNVLGKQHILQMIDFGMNPSYIFTHESTYKMRYTPSSFYFTTKYLDYAEEVADSFAYLNEPLSAVAGAYIEARDVLQTGVVRVTYSNGVRIYVNYTKTQVVLGGVTIEPTDYKVVV